MRTVQKAYPEREIARQNGDKTYFTGRPCKHGHLSTRFTVDASCVECREVALNEWRREHTKLKAREYRSSMTDEQRTEYLRHNAERLRNDRKKDPEKYRSRERIHGAIRRKRHPQRKLAETRKRQAAKQQRTPPWANLKAIQWFYEDCPEGYEVDHIAPLQGKDVCGLHVIGNLQYLTKEENRVKHISFDQETYSKQELSTWKQRGF